MYRKSAVLFTEKKNSNSFQKRYEALSLLKLI